MSDLKSLGQFLHKLATQAGREDLDAEALDAALVAYSKGLEGCDRFVVGSVPIRNRSVELVAISSTGDVACVLKQGKEYSVHVGFGETGIGKAIYTGHIKVLRLFFPTCECADPTPFPCLCSC
ncbi:MAG: hypothetical protein ABIH21_01300 [Patescibacteria group bacterium]